MFVLGKQAGVGGGGEGVERAQCMLACPSLAPSLTCPPSSLPPPQLQPPLRHPIKSSLKPTAASYKVEKQLASKLVETPPYLSQLVISTWFFFPFFFLNEKCPYNPALIWWRFGGKHFKRAASQGLDPVGCGLEICT